MNIEEKLRLLREGNFSLLTEASPHDIDDTPPAAPDDEDDKDPTTDDDKKPKSNAENEDLQSDDKDTDDTSKDDDDTSDTDTGDDISTGDDADTDPSGDGDAPDDDTPGDDNPDTPDGDGSDDETDTDDSSSNKQEFIQLDDNSRKLLDYKNFQKYRELRDDIQYLITELNELTLVNDSARNYTTTVISKSTDLLNKLNDYIVHKYKTNSYEINYRNFMDFVLEKRLVFQAKDEIVKLNTVK